MWLLQSLILCLMLFVKGKVYMTFFWNPLAAQPLFLLCIALSNLPVSPQVLIFPLPKKVTGTSQFSLKSQPNHSCRAFLGWPQYRTCQRDRNIQRTPVHKIPDELCPCSVLLRAIAFQEPREPYQKGASCKKCNNKNNGLFLKMEVNKWKDL